MAKEKTLVKKYFSITLMVILIGFIVLGTSLWVFTTKYWETEKKELLLQNATSISNFIKHNNVEYNDGLIIEEPELMQSVMNAFSLNINADIFVSDLDGNLILKSENLINTAKSGTIDKHTLSEIIKDEDFIGFSSLGGIYEKNYYVAAVPILNSKGDIIAATFVGTDPATLYSYRFEIFNIFFISATIILLLYFLCVGFLFYKMVKPLKQMAQAADLYSKGDFSKRIIVSSDDEIGRLSYAFNKMADSLSASENVRRNFIANVSHELKTPMNTISGFVDGILDGTIGEDKQKYYLDIVSKETKRLSRLVKSMLNLSRIDSGTLKLSKSNFDLFEVILSVLISFEKDIVDKGIKIMGLDDCAVVIVTADKDMIYQAVYNLIENAVKFTEPNGYIKINLLKKGGKVVFCLENSCEAMDAEDLKHIFDRFYKADKSRSKDKNGLGLGLYIVKKIIKSHKGEIFAQSNNNKCKFEFYLPLNN